MAFEQNPYALKISLVPDVSGVSAVAGQRVAVGIPFTAQVLTTGNTQNPLVFTPATIASASGLTTGTYTLPTTVTATANPILVGQVVNVEGALPSGYNGQLYVTATGGSASAWTFTANLATTAAAGTPTATNAIVRVVTAANESLSTSASVTASTQRPIGILQNQPYVWYDANGNIEGISEAEVTVSGVTKMVAGGTILPGQPLTIDASGRATAYTFPATAPSAATAVSAQFVIGTALTAGVSGDLITVAAAFHNAARGA